MNKYELTSGDLTNEQLNTMDEIITYLSNELEKGECITVVQARNIFKRIKVKRLIDRETDYDISFPYYLLDGIIKIIEFNCVDELYENCHNWQSIQLILYKEFAFEIDIFSKINE